MNVGKYALTTMGFVLAVATAQAGVTVTNVVIQQRYPWNGLVDINYEVVADDPNLEASIYPTGYDRQNAKYVLMSTLTGDGAGAKVKAGSHHMIWNMTADAPTLVSTNFSISLQAVNGLAPYLVVDLSTGPDALSYPIQYRPAIPDGGWTDEFKTTKMVLRLIMPDTFIMGSPEDELGRDTDETQHQVTLTKPYYIGVFEVTQKQWTLITGRNPSGNKGDMRPVDNVSYYETIRGVSKGSAWPTTNTVDAASFMGKLRAKTGLTFDLPTEAQWECACRAGTSTALNSGKNLSTAIGFCPNLSDLGRYNDDRTDNKGGYSDAHTEVGSYLPNAWGLYDMHGNVSEWCLDWYGAYPIATADPKGAESGEYRVLRGGYWNAGVGACRSASRNNYAKGSYGYNYYSGIGLRVLALPVFQ